MNDDVLVRVESVSKKFCRTLKKSLWYGMQDLGNELRGRCHGGDGELRPDEFWAVKDVSFELRRGECLGLIGRNGAGKTTLLRMLNGLIKPDCGRIEMRGRVGALIALGTGFNPILTGRENIYINATVLGLNKKEIDTKLDEIIEFSELEDFIDAPVQSYSSGMTVRLGFSIASTLKPDVLILDEILAVGDANFRSKCWHRIGNLGQNSAVILVSHEAYAISRICDRGIVLNRGHIKFSGNPNDALTFYSESITQSTPKVFFNNHENVKNFSLSAPLNAIFYGESFEFNLNIEMTRRTKIDHAVLNIVDQTEEVYAQTFLNFPEDIVFAGHNTYRVVLGPLYLPKAIYSVILLISTDGGKTPLVHSRNQISFKVSGHVSFGPKYYPPGKIYLITPSKNEG